MPCIQCNGELDPGQFTEGLCCGCAIDPTYLFDDRPRREEFTITDSDFIEVPNARSPQIDSELERRFARTFNVDDRIRFDMDGKITGTGTVLGLAIDHIIKSYIILLDKPIQGQKAILCSNTLMELL